MATTPIRTESGGGRFRVRRAVINEEPTSLLRPRTEATRERDVFRYLHSWSRTYKPTTLDRPAFPHDATQPIPQPESCLDTALAAFAQLGALRLNARRCLVTLLSTNVEFVLAESTRSMSLQYETAEDPEDQAWIGTCSFLRDEGINTSAINEWRKAKRMREIPDNNAFYYKQGQSAHWCIISDLHETEQYHERTFVLRGDSHRFFASVPLRDMQGSVIGSYTIIDDKPRYGVSTNEMAFMEDMADTVTEHLNATVMRSQRQRSERLIQGLGLFNKGQDSLREWWLSQETSRLRKGGRHQVNAAMSLQSRQDRADEEFGAHEEPGDARHGRGPSSKADDTSVITRVSAAAADELKTAHVATQDFDNRPDSTPPVQPDFVSRDDASRSDHVRGNRTATSGSRSSNFDLARECEHAYARASNLIREALHTEGVIFLNSNNAMGNIGRSTKSDSESDHDRMRVRSTSDERHPTASDTDTSDFGSSPGQTCKINGFSTRLRSTLATPQSSTQNFALSESHLARLVKNYPNGKIFNFGESGHLYSSSADEGTTTGSSEDHGKGVRKTTKRVSRLHGDARRLGKALIGARTIAFYPLWDETNDKWRSCILVWSTTPLRFFDQTEDITYLAAFGHSLMAELSRLETLAADKAKGTFISSVSHELRSPLHGVLAGVEFLQESELSPFQQEMVSTISMAGRTLLDTINHILDFSKISGFSNAQKAERAKADNARHQSTISGDNGELGVTAHVDLARLTEEVVETVVAAYRFERLSKVASTPDPFGEASNPAKKRVSFMSMETNTISIIVHITHRHNWVMNMSPGSWTRIITNIVGNAIKYTKKGYITITLDADQAFEGDSIPVRLTVEDTGIGISQRFIDNDLYMPFKQENSHSSGTGLGLNIVKQISKEMKANLNITSHVGTGTLVELDFMVNPVTESASSSILNLDKQLFASLKKLNLKRFHLLTLEDSDPSISLTEKKSDLGISILETGHEWLGCETSSGPYLVATSEPTVCIVEEEVLLQILEMRPDSFLNMVSDLSNQQLHILVLGTSLQSLSTNLIFTDLAVKAVLINQPIGPRKLLRSIMSGDDATTPRKTGDYALHDVHRGDTSPDTPRRKASISSIEIKSGQLHQSVHDKTMAGSISFTPRTADAGSPARSSTVMKLNRPMLRTRLSRHTTETLSRSPLLTPSALNASVSPFSTPEKTANSQNMNMVLLVEDNEVNMKLLMALMRKLNLPFKSAENGLEALVTYSENPSDFFLILMDISMPVMNGCAATAKIREVEKLRDLKACTIVAVTGVTSDKAREEAFVAGVDKFVTKPISMRELKCLVKDLKT